MSKRKRGRPRKKLTDDQIIQVESLAAVLSTAQIADYFGISRDVFYKLMNNNPVIKRRYKEGRSKAIASVGTGLLEKARGGDTSCMTFYLKTQAGWRETDKKDEEETNRDNNVNIIVTRE
jgi:3-hydroxyacyl-CoA dehydrogenase